MNKSTFLIFAVAISIGVAYAVKKYYTIPFPKTVTIGQSRFKYSGRLKNKRIGLTTYRYRGKGRNLVIFQFKNWKETTAFNDAIKSNTNRYEGEGYEITEYDGGDFSGVRGDAILVHGATIKWKRVIPMVVIASERYISKKKLSIDSYIQLTLDQINSTRL